MSTKTSDVFADATASDVPPMTWLTDDDVVQEYHGEDIHEAKGRERPYFWQRGGFFDTVEKCEADIDNWFDITERLANL